MILRDGVPIRHELKYSINQMQYELLRKKLKTVLSPDPYTGPDGKYHIRSLYFDDFRNTALFEKQGGVSRRKKYRMRIYNHSDDMIKLERKSKIDYYISKEYACITRDEAERILEGDVSFLSTSEKRLLRAFYLEYQRNRLRPNVLVDYYREAYVCPVGNVRITFDMGLHTALDNVDIFNASAFTMNIDDYPIILEIKYDNVLPEMIRGLLPGTIRPWTAIGKFVSCKRYTSCNSWEDQ